MAGPQTPKFPPWPLSIIGPQFDPKFPPWPLQITGPQIDPKFPPWPLRITGHGRIRSPAPNSHHTPLPDSQATLHCLAIVQAAIRGPTRCQNCHPTQTEIVRRKFTASYRSHIDIEGISLPGSSATMSVASSIIWGQATQTDERIYAQKLLQNSRCAAPKFHGNSKNHSQYCPTPPKGIQIQQSTTGGRVEKRME